MGHYEEMGKKLCLYWRPVPKNVIWTKLHVNVLCSSGGETCGKALPPHYAFLSFTSFKEHLIKSNNWNECVHNFMWKQDAESSVWFINKA